MTPLDAGALAALLGRLPGWRLEGETLARSYRFPSFTAAMAFMQRCAAGIERLDHHPDWRNVYDRVDVRLATHDAGDRVTALDGRLAELLDAEYRAG